MSAGERALLPADRRPADRDDYRISHGFLRSTGPKPGVEAIKNSPPRNASRANSHEYGTCPQTPTKGLRGMGNCLRPQWFSALKHGWALGTKSAKAAAFAKLIRPLFQVPSVPSCDLMRPLIRCPVRAG